MRGHLEQRGKNVWRAKVFLGRDDGTGRKRYLTRAVHGTKREAEDVLTQLLGEVARGASVGAATGAVAEPWARWIDINEDRLSPTTRRGYRQLMDRLILPASASGRSATCAPPRLTPSTPGCCALAAKLGAQ